MQAVDPNKFAKILEEELIRHIMQDAAILLGSRAGFFKEEVIKNCGAYPNVASRLSDALREHKATAKWEYGTNKIVIRHYDSQKLDAQTPLDIKTDFEGKSKKYTDLKYDGSHGWWRFFEYGSAHVNWGSVDFGFVPSRTGHGGWMKLAENKFKKMSPHPGVQKLGMFHKAWQVQKSLYIQHMPELLKEILDEIPEYVIMRAVRKAKGGARIR